ncbi:MAG: peptidoglycan-binding protein [Candidatus Sungbacteria bacterium]|uniref:Peptidoglycan-binding protein n=1 Tax=Candidatus Sungiibacteriota bacterium TaxID=2750080 RepID=A0A932VPK2_9BACT|nr:peptidoglycan-binding protein [Candidatus Sungbacteria bacterium]
MKKILFLGLVPILFMPSLVLARGFERDLYFGMRADPDVTRLQEFLRNRGYFTYPQSTGNYFAATRGAVSLFQEAAGIRPVSGYFGPKSRAAANRLLGPETRSSASGSGSDGGGTFVSATTSPSKGKIVIDSVSGSSSSADSESFRLENVSDTDAIAITGFQIQNSRGWVAAIPNGQELPGLNPGFESPIVLRPGDRAIISMGKQERHMNFRENLCTGYLDETSQFNPWLSHDCPRPNERALDASNPSLSDQCIAIITSSPSCRMIAPSFPSPVLDSGCASYVSAHFTYVGCVADYRRRSDFFTKRWLIWMQRSEEFFRNSVEDIVLKDAQGKIVDEYNY